MLTGDEPPRQEFCAVRRWVVDRWEGDSVGRPGFSLTVSALLGNRRSVRAVRSNPWALVAQDGPVDDHDAVTPSG